MNKDELSLILQEGEGLTIEFKENVNSDLSKEFVAMANSIGGRIFIGINNQSVPTGVAITNSLLSHIQKNGHRHKPDKKCPCRSRESDTGF